MKIIMRNIADYRRVCRKVYDYYNRYVQSGKPVRVEIKRALEQRSLQANRYYWGVVVKMVADYTGHESDEVHEFFKAKFLRRSDGIIEWTISTAALDKKEFADYIEKCKQWALDELNIVVPSPDEWDDFGDELPPVPF